MITVAQNRFPRTSFCAVVLAAALPLRGPASPSPAPGPSPSQLLTRDRVVDSRWSGAAPLLDGRAAEWKDDAAFSQRAAGVDVAFRNDGRDLYILLLPRNPKALKSLEKTGVAVFAGPAAAGRPATGVLFVAKRMKADDYIAMLVGRGAPPTEAERQALRAQKRRTVFLAMAIDRKGRTLDMPAPPSTVSPPDFAVAKEDAVTAYELRLPLASRGASAAGVGAAPGDAIVVEFAWGGKGDRVASIDTAWRVPQPSAGSPITGSGETAAQDFLSTFDRMSRPTTGGESYAFLLGVRLAAPPPPSR